MAFLFRRAQQHAPSPPPPPPPPHSFPQAPVSDRLIQPALAAYVSGDKVFDSTASAGDQVVQKGTLVTVARSIRHCVSGMSPWDISDLTLGLYKIATRHALEGVSDSIDGSVVSDKQELEEILYWLDWAWASYLADEKAITEFLHIEGQQLKKHVNTSAILKPAYCIAIDDAKKCVVLSIRGTYAATDVLTDLQPHSEKFEGGYAHSGILSAARWILENENDNLQILMSENLGYKLVLTGHSLGAGAACLLSYLLRESVGSGNTRISLRLGISSSMIECWGFGCPPCVDRQLCEGAPFIKNIVLQDDIVARASVAALEDLRSEILQTNWEDVLEDGGVAKKMLGLVNSTNAALGNVEQALGYARGTFFQQAKSLSYASMMESFRASVARGRQGPPVYFSGPPGHYGTVGHYGPPGHTGPPGVHGPPLPYGYPGHYGPLGSSGYPDVGNPYSTTSLQPYGVGSPRPQNLTQWISYGASALSSYLNTPGNSDTSGAAASREFMEGGRLFVPGILYHIKRSPLETSMAIEVNRLTAAEGVSREVASRSTEENSSSNTPAPIPVRHSVVKGLNPKSRFMKIVLSKSLLSDHSLVLYKDGIKDAIRWTQDTIM
ncbi:hypothetical protein GOP47_0024314 [Adiantum capillus-veneris]|uniref:Fungal lipase-type domain-containing protein n=1 Tax=Adiantum capillus-veneris TaxID=13818 RepID=A0A9D4U3U0_ADICA|nr:hypothetical protein GOP47_0024314 [Adiantum capillus-veneris]